ncbi:Ivy family C-type lysozyme inhibitor, partial [Escherichia coli]|nr:C-lysozyme inhibitor [Escherichia coli]EKM9482067.1 Ivy family C-type lysozyme inhibitor [Escherichia coli]HDL8850513.1 Ivy family C-type lysozyme inhibitor [Escherichia coli]
AWVMKGGTYTPAQTVTLGDETYQVMSACKPHDCGSQRIAVMWSEKSNQMTGLFSTIDEKTSQEKLTWLNVNDALSIDGKTVLFAALTGSLENHPDGFNFK